MSGHVSVPEWMLEVDNSSPHLIAGMKAGTHVIVDSVRAQSADFRFLSQLDFALGQLAGVYGQA